MDSTVKVRYNYFISAFCCPEEFLNSGILDLSFSMMVYVKVTCDLFRGRERVLQSEKPIGNWPREQLWYFSCSIIFTKYKTLIVMVWTYRNIWYTSSSKISGSLGSLLWRHSISQWFGLHKIIKPYIRHAILSGCAHEGHTHTLLFHIYDKFVFF